MPPLIASALAMTLAACGSAPEHSDYVKVGEDRALAEASEMLPADVADASTRAGTMAPSHDGGTPAGEAQ